jgi:hypothetical protein
VSRYRQARLLLIAGGVAIFLTALWLTLLFLDSRPTPPPTGTKFIFALRLSPGNWKVASNETTANVLEDGIMLKSSVPYTYTELIMHEISLVHSQLGKPYIIRYDIEVLQGDLALGLYDAAASGGSRRIMVDRFTGRRGEFRLSIEANYLLMAILNDGPPPTVAKIYDLRMSQE